MKLLKRIKAFMHQLSFRSTASLISDIDFDNMDFRDDFVYGRSVAAHRVPRPGRDFKSYRSAEEYDRDLKVIFKDNQRLFYIDFNHGDGHFRV